MKIQVTDTALITPTGQVAVNTPIKIVTVQGVGQLLTSATSEFTTDANGAYDFELYQGKHTLYVRFGEKYTQLGTVSVTEDVPDSVTIAELLAYEAPLTPEEIVIVANLVNEAKGYRDETKVFAEESHADAVQVALDKVNVEDNKNLVQANADQVALDKINVEENKDLVQTDANQVALDKINVEENKTLTQTNTDQVALDKINVEENKALAVDSKDLAKAWAVGFNPTGGLPTDDNNAKHYAELAMYNANQTFISGGFFEPTAEQEYPDVVGVSVDTVFIIKFDDEADAYFVTSGDLSGKTYKNGFQLFYDTPTNKFTLIPTAISGATSVNGVLPNETGGVTLTSNDFSDIYSATEIDNKTGEINASINELDSKLDQSVLDIESNKADKTYAEESRSKINTLESDKADKDETLTPDEITNLIESTTALPVITPDKKGMILQVKADGSGYEFVSRYARNIVQTHLTEPSSQTIAAGQRVDIVGLEVKITPSHANAKIKLDVRWSGEFSNIANYDLVFGIRKNGADIGNGVSAGARHVGIAGASQGYYASNADSTQDSSCFSFVDETSHVENAEITYTVTCLCILAGTLYNQRTVGDVSSSAYERLTSTIIAEEV